MEDKLIILPFKEYEELVDLRNMKRTLDVISSNMDIIVESEPIKPNSRRVMITLDEDKIIDLFKLKEWMREAYDADKINIIVRPKGESFIHE